MSELSEPIDSEVFDPPEDAVEFYADSLRLLNEWDIPFMLSGTYALACHTGIARPTKDIDVDVNVPSAPSAG